MVRALYIHNNADTEIRDGGLVFYLPIGFTSTTAFNKNVKLIEVGKSMDTFNYNNPLYVNKLISKIESLYDFDSDLRFIINFGIEESIITNDIINFYKKILHNKPILYLTNNINYLAEPNFILYNNNEWVNQNCDVHFIDALDRIKNADLGTIKKKFKRSRISRCN